MQPEQFKHRICPGKVGFCVRFVLLTLWLYGLAPGIYAAENFTHVVINEVLCSNSRLNYDQDFGAFSDWIELYNPTDRDFDMGGWYLSDNPENPDKWELPPNTMIESKGYLLFWADGKDLVPGQTAYTEFTERTKITVTEYHLNFKLNRELEEVLLFTPYLELLDSIILIDQQRDYSYGREIANPANWVYLGETTPLEENSSYASETFVTSGKPLFSISGGFYPATLNLELSSDPPGSVLKYTTDGSEPTGESPTYTAPIPVLFSQVIKARVFETGRLPGEVETQTYILDREPDLPVLSVSTDYQNLWDFDFGLYYLNLKNREVFAHLEYFDEEGRKAFQINAGLQLFGSQIFLYDQKPFSIFFRNRYGQESLEYQLFGNKEIASFNSLVLRNGGNDNNLTMFRDGFGAALVENRMDIDYQSYLPVVVYMNGRYWGIFNLREKLNEDYLESNHSVNPDYVDILEDSLLVNNGDANDFSNLLEFIGNNDLGLEDNFNYVAEKVDLDEFLNFMVYKIYGGYKQWQVNNKYWRERTPGSKWRWMAFDLEHCFAGPGSDTYDGNTLLEALEPETGSVHWPTLLFRRLMENETFRAGFLQRSALYMNTLFQRERVRGFADSLRSNIEDEMEYHIERWNSPVSLSAWRQNNNLLDEFVENRNRFMYQHLMDYFSIPDTSRLTVKCDEGGRVAICSSHIQHQDSATYTMFDSIPFRLRAIPDPGYAFSGWNRGNDQRQINLVIHGDTMVFASFEQTGHNVIPDTVRGRLVLDDADQPYYSSGNIVIPWGDSLIIGEGVNILMWPNSCIINQGHLSITGSGSKPVTIDINPDAVQGYLGSGPMNWGAVCINSVDTTRIFHTILKNASSGLPSVNFKAAVSATDSKVHLKDVTISGVQNPVYCYRSKVMIEACTLSSDGTGDLINLRSCTDPVILNNTLEGNFYEDTDGIDLDSVNGATVENNFIFSFFGPNSDGIDLGESSRNILIRNNIILSCSDKGISVGQASITEARNNLIIDCSQGFGIKDFHSFARINQNTLYNNRTGIACFEKNLGKGGGSAQVENTIISNSGEQSVYVDEYSSITLSYSLSDRDELLGYNNLLASPLFSNPSINDFRLARNSPCIDAGTPGQSDPDSTRADIGAFLTGNTTVDPQVHINEVNYNSHSGFNTLDWIEVYNPGSEPVDLSGWVFKGDQYGDEYRFPDHLILESDDYLVIAENIDSLKLRHSNLHNLVGNFRFGLKRDGELIRLYDASYRLVHSLHYRSEDPWPEGPDGKGATLELYPGETDNSDYRNWHASYNQGGTPGLPNSETSPLSGLYINEFMAKNDYAFADEFGEFDDWVEIFNSNNFSIDLGGVNFIYGNSGQGISMIPLYDEQSTTIEPFGFKFFWADKDPEQGILHMDFNISASGGTLGLGQVIDKEIHMIDSLEYNPKKPDIAFGRYPDGDVFLTELYLTPGLSNILSGTGGDPGSQPEIRIYPNPAERWIFIEQSQQGDHSTGELWSAEGKSLKLFNILPGETTRIDVSENPPGIYFIRIRGQEAVARKIVIF